jgi:site-specific DNA recombinase
VAAIPTAVQDLIDANDVRAAWDDLEVAQRRAALEGLGIEVVINRARGGPGFKPESVEVVWRRNRGVSE